MVTYQDLVLVGDSDRDRATFVKEAIEKHKGTPLYKIAKTADDYDRCRNTTIMRYQKTVATVTGEIVTDNYSATHRSTSNYFNIFTTQLNQYLLANGVTWGNAKTADKLGKDFDTRLQQAGKAALCGGVSFGFFNYDHMEVFSVLEFAPLYDEENGALAAGIRFWQIDDTKPMRATLYEMDGYTNYLWVKDTKYTPSENWEQVGNDAFMMKKMPYKLKIRETEADGAEIYAGENYAKFPIAPLWGNPHKQSELVGMQEKIDAYDFILNGFENDLDNAQIYWVIKGAGGMDDPDLMQFLDRLRTVKAAAPADGQNVTPVEVNIPYEAREKLLDRLDKQLYKDAMIMNPSDLASSAATATQIRAAYERQNVKADQFEYCVNDFVQDILAIAGIDDTPTFTRSTIVNTTEEVQTLVQAATYLGEEYVTRKILTLLGDGDQADEILKSMDANAAERLGNVGEDVTANE